MEKDDKDHADSVLQIALNANIILFNNLKEDSTVCEALMELFKPEFDAKLKEEVEKKDAIIADKDKQIKELQEKLLTAYTAMSS